MAESTLFTRIIRREVPASIVYEDEHTIAFLDIKPHNKGHTLVIPKQEVIDVLALDDATARALMHTIVKVAQAVKKATNADGVNIISNNGAAAGQVIFHTHFHIIPRYTGDGIFGGGAHTNYVSNTEQEKYAEDIKALLD